MIKALIFDADGVIVPHTLQFSKNLEKEYGISTKTTDLFFTTTFRDCLIGKKDLKELLKNHIKSWGWNKSIEELVQFWHSSEDFIDYDLFNYIETIKKQGIQCYLATNQEKYRYEYMLEKMSFKKLFNKTYSSSSIGYMKPSKEYYSHVYNDLNFKKEEILFWDDTSVNVLSAIEFGIHSELYISFEDFKEKMVRYSL